MITLTATLSAFVFYYHDMHPHSHQGLSSEGCFTACGAAGRYLGHCQATVFGYLLFCAVVATPMLAVNGTFDQTVE